VGFASTASLTSAADSHTHTTVPQQNSSFIGDLQTFLKGEDAARYINQFSGMVVSGGVDATGGTLTHTPTSLTAYPGGYYTTETGSVTYVSNSTCYLIAHRLTTGNLGTFQRQSGTHYLTDCTSPSKPALPSDSLWLATVVTNGSSVTAYTDLRTRVPYAGSYALAEIPSAGTRGRLALITDVNSGTLYWDTGSTWRQVTLNPMTFAGDLIVGGSSGAPTRLALGTANQILGVNSGATAHEYRSLTAGPGISVTSSTGAITFTATATAPAGSMALWPGDAAPSSWFLCDATAYNASTYPSLAAVMIPKASVFGRGTAVGTFTVDTATDIVTSASHGLTDGTIVHVASTTTLPTGLSANTVYYVISATSSTFKLSLTSGGGAIDISSTGSGTHSVYDEFQVPNFRGLMPMGAGTGSLTFNFAATDIDTGTEVITVPSNTSLYTGQPIVYTTSGTVAGDLVASTTYYAIRLSATTISIADSLALALAGTAHNLTGTGSGTHTFTIPLTARSVGERGGNENHSHVAAENAPHTHGVTIPTAGDQAGAGAIIPNDVDSTPSQSVAVTSASQGSGTAFSLINPYLAMNFIIKQ
jgi:hypothetical protein